MRFATALAVIVLAALPAYEPAHGAGCYADYKAKKERPLRLHYGVISLPGHACSQAAAGPEIARRIARQNWELLVVMSVFGPEGLEARRRDAGEFFLAF